ncbi:2-isopropylmalate synthase [Buchnera aphidicola (Formosaphis micheliae)]|uniref:2-isopropylmalate synthase n=1 Tax=Buchnera aphidicola TaxID=9 RepID=UPI0031B7F95F
MKEKIIIFDTSLRDGEQSLRTSLNIEKKLKIALALEKLNIDIIEVGFPISSPEDFNAIVNISKVLKKSKICSLARCVKKDIDAAAEAMKISKNFRIHIFLGTSPLHIQSKLKKNFSEILELSVSSIKYAKRYTNDIEFSCEDASRTPIDNLCYIVEQTIKAGASTINIPDTVGYATPNEFSKVIQHLYNSVPNINKAIISVHCHNDLGMAVANSIAAIQFGARQIEGTINGIGERAGNTALEEVIMAIKIKEDLLNVYTNIDHKKIYETSKIISRVCQVFIPSNKAIVGSNAFSHSSGIHQDGIIKNRKNYEIIIPESIGFKKHKLNLTSRSGRAAIKYHMQMMGYNETEYNIESLYTAFLKLADNKGQVFDYELETLAFIDPIEYNTNYFNLKNFDIHYQLTGNIIVKLEVSCGENIRTKIIQTKIGIFHAIFSILNDISNLSMTLKKITLFSEGNKIENSGQVNVTIIYKKRKFYGIGTSHNIFKSFIKSIIHVLNDIWKSQKVFLKLIKNSHQHSLKN